jgi:hypothetical protein
MVNIHNNSNSPPSPLFQRGVPLRNAFAKCGNPYNPSEKKQNILLEFTQKLKIYKSTLCYEKGN